MAADQLVADLWIGLSPSARSQLAEGEADTRLLLTPATLAASEPIRITAFTDAGPGASAGTRLRAVELVATHAGARHMLALFRAQRPPYLPAQAGIAPGPAAGRS